MKTVRLLFNDDMARAIVEGRKTVTRRPVDFRKLPHGVIEDRPGFGPWPFWEDECGDWHPETRCASPGDILIGRECWAPNDGHEPFYRATDGEVGWRPLAGWRPSIHMPDWAARIHRRVVSVTVERLQDISHTDAAREGFADRMASNGTMRLAWEKFRSTWDSIYAAKGLGWHIDPWVWRIEFERENVQETADARVGGGAA